MLDPATDDLEREWCYLARSTTVIGVPYQPDAVQVTYDGAIYTGQAELGFFYGESRTPLLARQKTFLEGWIPIAVYDWQDGPVRYDFEAFGAVLEGEDESNTLQFVRLRARNTGSAPATARGGAALRHSAGAGRFGGTAFAPTARFEMTADAALRDGAVVYLFPPNVRKEAVSGKPYTRPFSVLDESVTAGAAVCLTASEATLGPGETRAWVFKMPRVPVPASQSRLLEKIRAADYDAYRARTIEYWRGLMARGADFQIPEARVNAAWRASLVHLLLATRSRGGARFQTSGLPYPDFFMIDFVDMRLAYDTAGHPGFSEQSFPQIFKRQLDDGLFCDTSLSHGKKLWSSHGHMLYALTHHYLMTRDAAYARSVLPEVRRAVEWIRQAREQDEYGLMPPAWPYDAEMIDGRYTSHNLWCLLGLRTAIRMARELGETQDAAQWTALHDAYLAAVRKALEASAGERGYVPTGLYRFRTGPAAREGFQEYQTDQDWENMLLLYPTEVLELGDPRVPATLEAIRRAKYREGIMTYRNGQHLHQYVTANLIEQYLLLGQIETALRDFYHILLHSGSTHEGFENMVEPWQSREVIDIPPPHAWAAAKVVQLTRNLLLVEFGGRAGLDEGQRDLHVFPAISPAWVAPGLEVAFRDAPTEMGNVTARLRFDAAGADLTLSNRFHQPPRDLVLRVPYFVELTRFESNGKRAVRDGDLLRLSPDTTRVRLDWIEKSAAHARVFQELLLQYRREPGFWKGPRTAMPDPPPGFLTAEEEQHPPARLSFNTVLDAFRHEYGRRYAGFVAGGGKPVRVEAPPLLTEAERRRAFGLEFGTFQPTLTTGKPASASSSIPNHPPTLAVDGVCNRLPSSWQADPYPQWFEIDLEQPVRLDRVRVHPYWGGGRYYRYTVEISEDRRVWKVVADLSQNLEPATPEGTLHRFAPQAARYLRVNMLYHNLNAGVHLVEVQAFAAE